MVYFLLISHHLSNFIMLNLPRGLDILAQLIRNMLFCKLFPFWVGMVQSCLHVFEVQYLQCLDC